MAAEDEYIADFVEEEARAGRGTPPVPLKNIITKPTAPAGAKATAASPGFGSPTGARPGRSTSPRDLMAQTGGSVLSVVEKAPELGFTGPIQPHTYRCVDPAYACGLLPWVPAR